MGVVRERKKVHDKAKTVPSNPESTANSMQTSQDASEDETQFSDERPRPERLHFIKHGPLNVVFHRLITQNTGKRQARRILNNRYLEMLNEEGDECIVDERKTKFQLLMEETDNALDLLDAYDREQNARNCDDFATGFEEYKVDGLFLRDAYFLIPRKIRMAIGSRKNFQYELLKSLEMLVARQLMSLPTGEFIHKPHTCYERLLMHAIAKFKGLQSETIIEGDDKLVKIITARDKRIDTKTHPFLCDYINTMRVKSLNV